VTSKQLYIGVNALGQFHLGIVGRALPQVGTHHACKQWMLPLKADYVMQHTLGSRERSVELEEV
jgi:hypothetical protein